MLRTTIAALGVAAITVLATPVAATAATSNGCGDNYALPGTVISDVAVVDGGGSVTVTWRDGYFPPNVPVEVVASGPGAAGSSMVVSGPASSDTGSLWATATAAEGASGALTITATSECAVGGVTVEVAGSGAPAASSGTPASSSGGGALAATGASVPMVLSIAGGGALAFGAILLGARARRRVQD